MDIGSPQSLVRRWETAGARGAVAARVRADGRRPRPLGAHGGIGLLVDLDEQRIAWRRVVGVRGPAVAARAGREASEEGNFGEELDVVAAARGRRLHEVLARRAVEAGAHEDVADVVDVRLGRTDRVDRRDRPTARRPPTLMTREERRRRERARQVRMAAVVVLGAAAEHRVGVRIAPRADDVVDAAAERVGFVPRQRVVRDRRHGAHVRKARPQPVARGEVRRLELARLGGVEAFVEVVEVPEVEVADLRAFGADDAERAARRHLERPAVARRDDDFTRLAQRRACARVVRVVDCR
mmetsp:Transcript_17422/g.70007  ORF Transcript_17422/g.70007 Transcript_17422/m.70007 type:complete len:297 (+) Transcript_17422:154-1044(+)